MSPEEGTIFCLDELGRTMVVVLRIFKGFAHLRAVLAPCGRRGSVAPGIFLICNEYCSHELLAYSDPSFNRFKLLLHAVYLLLLSEHVFEHGLLNKQLPHLGALNLVSLSHQESFQLPKRLGLFGRPRDQRSTNRKGLGRKLSLRLRFSLRAIVTFTIIRSLIFLPCRLGCRNDGPLGDLFLEFFSEKVLNN